MATNRKTMLLQTPAPRRWRCRNNAPTMRCWWLAAAIFFLALDGDASWFRQRQQGSVFVTGFAYAPNFITKIIQEDTGMTPLVAAPVEEVNGKSQSKNGGHSQPAAEMMESTTTTATITATNTAGSPVTTRFPPEPNGYLHLGHAKAISFNFAVARMFGGTCHMRMDDTNPSKEDEEYVASILEDVKWIQSGLYDDETKDAVPWEGPVRKTSSYFDIIYDCAEALIQQGDAYVDSLSAEEMREYRGTLTEPGKDSPYRTRSVEESMELFRKVRLSVGSSHRVFVPNVFLIFHIFFQ